MKIRETKSVYFSLMEEFDVKLLEHAKQINNITGKERNFSRYIRKLIYDDMMGVVTTIKHVDSSKVESQLDFSNETIEAMGSFL